MSFGHLAHRAPLQPSPIASFDRWCKWRVERLADKLDRTANRIHKQRRARATKADLPILAYEARGNTVHAPGSFHPYED